MEENKILLKSVVLGVVAALIVVLPTLLFSSGGLTGSFSKYTPATTSEMTTVASATAVASTATVTASMATTAESSGTASSVSSSTAPRNPVSSASASVQASATNGPGLHGPLGSGASGFVWMFSPLLIAAFAGLLAYLVASRGLRQP